jgi:hypothetical protein
MAMRKIIQLKEIEPLDVAAQDYKQYSYMRRLINV